MLYVFAFLDILFFITAPKGWFPTGLLFIFKREIYADMQNLFFGIRLIAINDAVELALSHTKLARRSLHGVHSLHSLR